MIRAHRRFFLLLAFLPAAVVVLALIYMLGMSFLEEKPRDFWTALSWAAETITTTGYGGDSHWHHPVMVLFVVVVQFAGVVLIYMIVPFYLIPYIDERFESRLPRQAPKMSGHVVVHRYGAAVESLLEQLRDAEVPTLVVESDEAVAREMLARKYPVVYSLQPDDALRHAQLTEARAIIANGSDEENAGMILLARQVGFTGDILALVEEPHLRRPMSLAGADAVYTPRHLLATALAARASHRIQPRISGIQALGRHLEVSELRIDASSELVGKTLGETHLGAKTGTTIIGQWVEGTLQTGVTAAMRLEARGILIAVGRPENLAELGRLAGGTSFLHRQGPFVIGGCGLVGGKIRQLLQELGEKAVVIDRREGEGVDIVGDVLDPQIMKRLDPDNARGIILALDSDSATLFATMVLRQRSPDVPIIARVNEAHNVERIHRAGADFALSVSQVAGQILAHRLLREEAVSIDPHLKVLRVPGPRLGGRRVAQLGIRERFGCSIVAVERGETVLVNLGGDFVFQPDDTVYVGGSREATRNFVQELGSPV